MRLGETTEGRAEQICFKGRTYRARLTFRRVITAAELLRDRGIRAGRKTDRTLSLLLTRTAYIRARLLEATDRARLLSVLLDAFSQGGDGERGERVISLDSDGELIYAAFLQSYGIDLSRDGDRLSWRKFLLLLGCIPQGTQLSEIMRIRAAEVPTDNPRYARELIRLKTLYGINGDSYAAGLDGLFGRLCRAAEKEKKNG